MKQLDLCILQKEFREKLFSELLINHSKGFIACDTKQDRNTDTTCLEALQFSIKMQEYIELAYKMGAINEANNWLNTGESVTFTTPQ